MLFYIQQYLVDSCIFGGICLAHDFYDSNSFVFVVFMPGCLESSGFSGHNSLPSLTALQPKSENTTENIQTDSHSIEKTQQLREDIHGMPPIGSSSAVHAVSVNPSHERNYQTFHANYCYNASTPAVSIANEHQHHHDISSLANVTPGMYALHPNLHVHQFSGKKETELPSHNPSPSLPSNDQLDSGTCCVLPKSCVLFANATSWNRLFRISACDVFEWFCD